MAREVVTDGVYYGKLLWSAADISVKIRRRQIRKRAVLSRRQPELYGTGYIHWMNLI